MQNDRRTIGELEELCVTALVSVHSPVRLSDCSAVHDLDRPYTFATGHGTHIRICH
jgi:hypothetical protein